MLGHGALRRRFDRLGVLGSLLFPFRKCPASRQIAVDGIMRGRLVGDRIGPDASAEQLRHDLRRIPEKAN